MRALQRLRVPTIVFVNKMDRMGADVERMLADIRRAPVAGRGRGGALPTSRLLAELDEALLAAYVDGETADPAPRSRG